MDDGTAIDLILFIFRVGIGLTIAAHGYNHIFGGGRIEGTAGWFGSIGMKQPRLQAWLASLTEIGAGALLVLGLLTPLGGAGLVGVMLVAWITAHRNNGFFIFKPGQGWEYVAVLALCGLALGALGAGSWSLDDAFGLTDDLIGWPGLLIAAAGIPGAAVQLAVFWRPTPE